MVQSKQGKWFWATIPSAMLAMQTAEAKMFAETPLEKEDFWIVGNVMIALVALIGMVVFMVRKIDKKIWLGAGALAIVLLIAGVWHFSKPDEAKVESWRAFYNNPANFKKYALLKQVTLDDKFRENIKKLYPVGSDYRAFAYALLKLGFKFDEFKHKKGLSELSYFYVKKSQAGAECKYTITNSFNDEKLITDTKVSVICGGA